LVKLSSESHDDKKKQEEKGEEQYRERESGEEDIIIKITDSVSINSSHNYLELIADQI
jgi:hypothetical protein